MLLDQTVAHVVLGVAAGLQVIAALIAVTGLRGRRLRLAWLLVGSAFVFQAWRRYAEIVHSPHVEHGTFETVTALIVSVLLLIGVAWICSGLRGTPDTREEGDARGEEESAACGASRDASSWTLRLRMDPP